MNERAASQQKRLIALTATALLTLGLLLFPLTPMDIAVAEDIFIDPGHGGRYPGAYYAGVSEASVNLMVSLAVREELRERGHNTNMSRTTASFADPGDIATWHYWDPDGDDVHYVQYAADGRTGIYDYSPDEDSGAIPYDDLQKRCDMANAWGADLYVSIHANASSSSSARGLETYHNWDNTTDLLLSQELAQMVQQEIVLATGMPSRKVDDVGYYVIRWSNMPGILIETGFLSNPIDRSFLLNPTFRARMADGIANGIERFLATDPFQPMNERIMGGSRYGTAVAVANEGWPKGADTVLLASGENWPDSLASVPLSTKLDAPILLTQSSKLPTETAVALDALAPSRIVIVGGEVAITSDVASAAASAASLETSTGVTRIAGLSRYDTAAAIATTLGPVADVVIVSGETFPDAVSA
nr:N-acetylmuramoyl-L-alanine amidase [Actinomycetota bacterium]